MSETLLALAIGVALASSAIAALHAILYKRDVRAAIGWAGFIVVAPYVGPLIYLLFGVNRIRRRAGSLRTERPSASPASSLLPELHDALVNQALLGDRVCNNRFHPGNRIEVLDGGESAFPAMLRSIDAAQRRISIATYIFEHDSLGRRFVDALAAATRRGIEVRVLLDAVGSRSRRPDILAALAAHGVRAALFLPPRNPLGILAINLRNHRKLTIVDDAIAFTGGMNLSGDYAAAAGAERKSRDIHFSVEGPAVAELQRVFAADWFFATRECLDPANTPPERVEGVPARIVADGPDEGFERTRWLILGAIAMARRSVRVVTPYFLPDMSLITALNVAALRGVAIEILIPERLDHAPVKWASNALLWQVLHKGCRVWFTPPPFDHSKLFTVDGLWTLIGSSNWDARSLRLNFELNVEIAGTEMARKVDALIDERRSRGRPVTLEEIDARPLPVRIRDGLARLFTPYL